MEHTNDVIAKQYEAIYDAVQELYATEMYQYRVIYSEFDVVYYKVEVIRYEKELDNIAKLMERILCGLYSMKIGISFILYGDSDGVSLYWGTQKEKMSILKNCVDAHIPGVEYTYGENHELRKYNISDIIGMNKKYRGGLIVGIPLKSLDEKHNHLIDNIAEGMRGREFFYRVDATPKSRAFALAKITNWSMLFDGASEIAKQQISYIDNSKTIASEKPRYKVSKCAEISEGYCRVFDEMLASGGWEVISRYGSPSGMSSVLLSGIIVASLSDTESVVEPMRSICIDAQGKIEGARFIDYVENECWIDNKTKIDIPRFKNFYSSSQLAECICLPHNDYFGLSIREQARFEVSRISDGNICIGNIVHLGTSTKHEYKIDVDEFNRHCLVAGLTGGGKTNTIKSLLCDINQKTDDVNVLIIEPAKREYWELYKLGFSDLNIYCIGGIDDGYYINIFEKVGNVPIQTHIDYVLAAFKASFIMYTPMPYVLEKAVYAIYEDCGWDVSSNISRNESVYPTIENLYYKIPIVVDEMGYDSKMQQDLIGSLQARINSMRVGAKGKTLNVSQSVKIDDLLGKNTILELEDIADDEIKAFIMSMIMVQVLEYRAQQPDSQNKLKHLLLIEEAHRLLKNISSGTGENADPRGNAVEFFCNMLAELRSKGQGFIIADQIPSKLAPDVVKNTNIKITHRMVDGQERMLIGNSMHMTEEQIEALASLRQGYAAIYAENDERPKLVYSKYAGSFIDENKKELGREEVLKHCHIKKREGLVEQRGLSEVCARCYKECDGTRSKLLLTSNLNSLVDTVISDLDKCEPLSNQYLDGMFSALEAEGVSIKEDEAAVNCFINELISKWEVPIMRKSKFINLVYQYLYNKEDY